ncbi:LmeA family phospholipid-binding protein [Mycobacterium shinjukuense]|uniref:Uncharacterized protein n=1 Tax=Mycobacterium shinjukuense TaxID=398694 RepID=A0A7I7MU94_9MYCO|nr:DUF2993 domain-containing protein [Mycobacterium shinjukuense]MCV6985088.1 LmeA family phospholipid-binding protein [Mycobacterium shinjukuense]ORB70770.1 hypothetical protein BST45_05090 [Mycobacterium shinjukuense]BBX75053.1 hypothetical protein MSHI_29590 [Mycobacterium shinjukuense]
MTHPQGPLNDGPSTWARPGAQGPLARTSGPAESSGGRLRPGAAGAGHTHDPQTVAGRSSRQTEPLSAAHAQAQRPGYGAAGRAGTRTTPLATADEGAAPAKGKRRRFRDPLSVFLILIIVFSLVLAGLIGAELYVRNQANDKVAAAVACEVRDQATASFGVAPLVLWQVITRHFTNISVETAGHQVRDAKGMKIQITISNVRLTNAPGSKGTIGALDATITWTAEGIKESVQNALPILGPFVTSSVVTHPKDGTIELKGMLDDIVAKPVVAGNGIELQILSFNTLGFSLPRESVQSMLNDFTANLTKNYPLGIHADSVQVTSTGVISHFSTRDATIPADSLHPCFANL